VAGRVTDDNDGLETCALTGTGLLLDGLDLFVGEDMSALLYLACDFLPEAVSFSA